MEPGMDRSWHQNDKLQKALLKFHEEYASFPRNKVAAAQLHHVQTMSTIRKYLQSEKLALEFQFTGSTYEGIKVPSTDVEFDVMVVLAGGKEITATEKLPLYAELHTSSSYEPLSKMSDASGVLIPKKAAEYFFSKLQRTINRYSDLESKIKLRMHGPAVQMDVYKDNYKKNLFYSVDMVPSFYVYEGFLSGSNYYVAKGFKEAEESSNPCTWRKSFSLDEKSEIQTIDSGNQCRKQCMRILKVLRDEEAGLQAINSYIIKTAVLSLNRDYNLNWSQKYLGQRFIDILKFLAKAFENCRLPHYYEQNFNILESMSPIHLMNMETRLKELIRSEQYFHEALSLSRSHVEFVQYGSRSADAWFTDSPQYMGNVNSSHRVCSPDVGATFYDEPERTTARSEGGSHLGALLLGGAALAGALWLGASLLDKKDSKKEHEKK